MNWKSGHKLCQSLATLCVRRRSKFSGSSRPLDFAQFCWSRCDCCVANDLARKIQRCANLKSVIDSSIQWLCLSCDDREANIERWELPVGLQNWSLCYQHQLRQHIESQPQRRIHRVQPTGRRCLMPRSDRPTFGIPAMLKDSQSLSSVQASSVAIGCHRREFVFSEFDLFDLYLTLVRLVSSKCFGALQIIWVCTVYTVDTL